MSGENSYDRVSWLGLSPDLRMVMSSERALGARAGELNRGASCVATIAAAGILQRESKRTRAEAYSRMNPSAAANLNEPERPDSRMNPSADARPNEPERSG
jgi:hypothetical protein